MSAQHTPLSRGPWAIGGNGATVKVVDADGKAVCMVTPRSNAWNGDVLAASLDLLAACKSAIPTNLNLTNNNISDNTIVQLDIALGDLRAIRAAIAKAEGGAA